MRRSNGFPYSFLAVTVPPPVISLSRPSLNRDPSPGSDVRTNLIPSILAISGVAFEALDEPPLARKVSTWALMAYSPIIAYTVSKKRLLPLLPSP